MEINITEFYTVADPATYSASRAEIGDNAGAITWQAAKDADFNLLDNADKLQAMRAWALFSGGWNEGEVAAWTDGELNALFIQLVSGDIREKGDDTWAEYQAQSEAGQVSGALFEGIDGHIYYYLGE
jgi:hypothetical protein